MSSLASMNRSYRKAFTLVELLVVIAIIGVLVSLLLPAVNSAREAARRLQCKSNIRQIGLAVMNFESANGALPPGGWLSYPDESSGVNCGSTFSVNNNCFDLRGTNGGPTVSWIVLVLPFMEEQALFDDFDFTRSVFDQPANPQQRQVGSLTCPTDPGNVPYNGDGVDNPNNQLFSKGNYAAYTSPVHINQHRRYPAALGGFKVGERLGQKLRRVVDGTSKTVLSMEVRKLDRDWDQRGVWALPWPGSTLLGLDWHPCPASECPQARSGNYVPDPNYIDQAQMPNNKSLSIRDQVFKCKRPGYAAQQGMPCKNMQFLSASARSLHPGGLNAVALDVHVGFISDAIDSYTFAYLIASNDKSPSDVSEYLK
jgi:prepilin-type N-terminal cleavage/methylation domain-containing protein